MKSAKKPPLLQVKNLETAFEVGGNWASVVRGVSFDLQKGESLGIIGESGCGKTVTSLSLMRLIPSPMGKIKRGEIWLENKDLLQLPVEQFRPYRGKKMAMIFQDPMTSLNPVLNIGVQIFEVLLLKGTKPSDLEEEAATLLDQVGIADAKRQLKAFPHQLSGGMKQRVMVAIALAQDPEILIADEPTTALDVTIQAQILRLLKGIQKERGMSLIMITHDLGVVAQSCDRVLVMYGGKIVEEAEVNDLFSAPKHPYTQGLMRSIKSLTDDTKDRLDMIPGMVPVAGELPEGCSFQNRCSLVVEKCKLHCPALVEVADQHFAACIQVEMKKEGQA